MPDGALTPPELELMVIGVAGGSAGSGAPTSVSVRTPATFVNGPAPSGFGSNRTPVVVRYGFSVRVAFASDVLPWTMSRCFWTRYSTEVTNTVSGSGLTVTVAVAGAETPPPALLAVTEMVMTALGGATLPLEAVQAKVIGPVPVEVAARPTVPPAATVYGPPALTVTGMQAGVGMMLPGHGLSCPGITPVLEG